VDLDIGNRDNNIIVMFYVLHAVKIINIEKKARSLDGMVSDKVASNAVASHKCLSESTIEYDNGITVTRQ